MSTGEIVSLAVIVALVGAVTSAFVLGLVISRQNRNTALHLRRLDAYSKWLAARLVFSRTTASFVASFRALDDTDRDSTLFSLRKDEAQRSRSAWCQAIIELDRAEATLIVFGGDSAILAKLVHFKTTSAEAVRDAIDGDAHAAKELDKLLRRADRDATEYAYGAAINPATPGSPRSTIRRIICQLGAKVESVIDHWASP